MPSSGPNDARDKYSWLRLLIGDWALSRADMFTEGRAEAGVDPASPIDSPPICNSVASSEDKYAAMDEVSHDAGI